MVKWIKFFYRLIRNQIFYSRKSNSYNIKLFNYQWDNTYHVPNHWLYQYIKNLDIVPPQKILSIYSVNGERLSLFLNRSDYRIFYTVENVHVSQSHWEKYADLMLNDKRILVSIGFDNIVHDKYVRFPYWLMTNFRVNETIDSIHSVCKSIDNSEHRNRTQFCSFICRSDYFGDRTKFADLVETIAPINYPGNFRHNDDTLKSEFNDNKIEYLKQFKFNLCPENSDSPGYVTEKIFDAIKAGCIPVYWGSGNCPEPKILNQNRILFLRLNEDNTEVLQKIKYLNENEMAYNEFRIQPAFTENAPEIIYGYFERLEKKLKEIIR